jgi:hypothetical protein
MAQLRYEHPGAREESLRRLIDWAVLRRLDETREGYAERVFGPMEPLP